VTTFKHVFPPIETNTLSVRVAQRLVRQIINGELVSGAVFPTDGELARQFDVSRAVIREAVKEVAVLGLLDRRQGRETRVAPRDSWRQLSPEVLAARIELGDADDAMLELLELRRMIELEAAALSASRARDSDIAEMRRLLEVMDGQTGAPESFIESDISFHTAILAATRNQLIVPLFQQLRPLLLFGRRLSVAKQPDMAVEAQRGHRAIFDAIADRSPERAREQMAEHLSWTANLSFSQRQLRPWD
jgi:DNA-binding FadR family transcriptional regulator